MTRRGRKKSLGVMIEKQEVDMWENKHAIQGEAPESIGRTKPLLSMPLLKKAVLSDCQY